MNSNEAIAVARLADHYEKHLTDGQDPLEVATHDFNKLKREAPRLLSFLRESDRSDRGIGDWLYAFLVRAKGSGMSLKNFAADELERLERGEARPGRRHATKKSPAQLQREIDEVLAKPAAATALEGARSAALAKTKSGSLEDAISKARMKTEQSHRRHSIWLTREGEYRVRPLGEKVSPLWFYVRDVPSEEELRAKYG